MHIAQTLARTNDEFCCKTLAVRQHKLKTHTHTTAATTRKKSNEKRTAGDEWSKIFSFAMEYIEFRALCSASQFQNENEMRKWRCTRFRDETQVPDILNRWKKSSQRWERSIRDSPQRRKCKNQLGNDACSVRFLCVCASHILIWRVS